MSNIDQQQDEILALSSIFSETFSEIKNNQEDEGITGDLYQVVITPTIPTNEGDEKLLITIDESYDYNIYFSFQFPPNYPESEPPLIYLKSTWMEKSDTPLLYNHLIDLWQPNELVIFQMISWIQENCVTTLNQYYKDKQGSSSYHNKQSIRVKQRNEQQQKEQQNKDTTTQPLSIKVPTIYTGPAVTEKKSKFQAHLAIVKSEQEVEAVLNQLLSHKKIYDATHNMYAYRIKSSTTGELNEYGNDDGEAAASDKMLFTLIKTECEEILVVVSRWFGGILLGGNRFHHIVNVTNEIIQFYKSNTLDLNCSLEFNK
ncbi:hypothetical protein CYY_008428 [Polysphondylium violaceum]|uniref:RWD domain-containing protein n=1 Tax=Polysphondylium violaceum TaxID=133409 RepID=A0A8J4PLP6_9MYCE|nr:hypothetical protein CYY_008428 [Polysphondylium violaceum]